MAKKTTIPRKSASELNASDLLDRILGISSAVFARMVMKSGLTNEEARELCAVHKALSK